MVSLIIATINRLAEVDRLLSSLDGQSYPQFEVILVDQNRDERLQPVLSRHTRLNIQHQRSERGLSRARNAGLRRAQGAIIAIPDDDCWYPPDLLASVVGWFDAHREFGLLGAALRTESNQRSGPNSPRNSEECTKRNVWECAVSTALFMRSAVCAAIGEFNENLGLGSPSVYQSGEETDYILRALERGLRMWFEPSLTVHHPALDSISRLKQATYPFAVGTGGILRIHKYPLREVGRHLIRSCGGAALSLCRGDFARAHVYALRAAGQAVGYISASTLLARSNARAHRLAR